jgi:hypothetical protein
MLIGIDFDNTIIGYDDVFLAIARERGLVDPCFRGRKQAIRDAIRLLSEGELAWQKLQGEVYGAAIGGASLFDGVDGFLRRCRREQCRVVIVSHKTEFGHHDPRRINLREAALGWMTQQGFFHEHGYGLEVESVIFEDTRADKLTRIASLNCTHFIDDLVEVLSDPGFPNGVNRILFSETEAAPAQAPYVTCRSWRLIEEHIFGGG